MTVRNLRQFVTIGTAVVLLTAGVTVAAILGSTAGIVVAVLVGTLVLSYAVRREIRSDYVYHRRD